MPENQTARLNQLEETVAFQQRTIDQLNDVLVQLHTQVDQMYKSMKHLEAKQQWLAEHATTDDVPNERPPHY